jgi:regulator of replication initiation timing
MTNFLEALIPIIGIIMVFGIPISAILTSHLYKMKKLDKESSGVNDEELRELRQQIGQVMAENELLKDAVQDLQQHLGQASTRINLSQYEKEQIRLDQENKGFNDLY